MSESGKDKISEQRTEQVFKKVDARLSAGEVPVLVFKAYSSEFEDKALLAAHINDFLNARLRGRYSKQIFWLSFCLILLGSLKLTGPVSLWLGSRGMDVPNLGGAVFWFSAFWMAARSVTGANLKSGLTLSCFCALLTLIRSRVPDPQLLKIQWGLEGIASVLVLLLSFYLYAKFFLGQEGFFSIEKDPEGKDVFKMDA